MTLRLNGSSSGYTEIDAPAAAGSNTITLPTSNGSAEQFLKNSGTAGELEFSSMVETSTGVGIGTTSPSHNLDILSTSSGATVSARVGSTATSGANNANLIINNGGTGNATLRFDYESSSNRASIGVPQSAEDLFFTTSGDERMRIDSSGRLLVGATSSSTSQFLQIQGDTGGSANGGTILLKNGVADSSAISGTGLGVIAFGGSTGNQYCRIEGFADGSGGTNDYPGRLTISTTANGASSPTERFKISNDGSFRVQGVYDFTLASSANVHVDSGGLIRRVTSSAKYKTNIETIEDSYADALLNCRPVWYQSTCEGDNPDYGWWGFIAEEVAEIDPRLVHWKTTNVTYDEDGKAVEAPCDPEAEGVLYDRFVPHLVNLVKRQKAQIDDLLARVTALEAA